MSGPNEKAEELIGAYLDGELRPTERLEVERYLQSDPQAADLLAQMQSIRTALQSAPKRKLPANFSDRIIAAARQDAAQLGPAAPHWLRSTSNTNAANAKAQKATTEPQSSPLAANGLQPDNQDRAVVIPQTVEQGKPSRQWIAILAIAASTIIVAFIGFKQFTGVQDPGRGQQIVSDVPTEQKSSSDATENVDRSNQVVANSDDRTKSDVVGQPELVVPSPDNIANVNPDNSIPKRNDDVPPVMPLETPVVPNGTEAVVANNDADMQKQLDAALAQSTKDMMFVVDISESETSAKANALRQTFERYNIAYELPIDITPELHSSLEKNRMVGPIAPIGGTIGDEVSLVFVKASGSRLDAAITDLFSRYEEFPEMAYDMVLNPPAPEALEMLKSIREFNEFDASEEASKARGLARGLKITDRSFVGPARLPSADISVRKQASKPAQYSPDMDPVAYCLFIIRKPATPK
jgi:anti-sigma factor RsiW